MTPDFGFPQVDIMSPDISAFRAGNRGVEYVDTFDSGRHGPHLLLNALTHGNEICGATALAALHEMNLRPQRGKLTLVFANVAAFLGFDPVDPYANRFVDEDFNRIWRDDYLDSPRISAEVTRARKLRPIYAEADVLLDLHSMSNNAAPLLLCGRSRGGRELARRLSYPAWAVADDGHRAGPRLIDYAPFVAPNGDRTAILAECGQHWAPESGAVALEICLRLLDVYGMLDERVASAHPPPPAARQRLVEVSHAVTARTDRFAFCENYVGLEVIPHAGAVIGFDGDDAVTTPYDNCVLVMPTRHVQPGQTAVRFGRIVPW